MGFRDRFRKKKKEEKPEPEAKKVASDLELICGDDKEAYEALRDTMLLNPGLIKESVEEVAEKAKEFEKSGDLTRAAVQYKIAGGLALYQANVAKVKQYFGKYQELSPKNSYKKILEIPERAIQKAQEYYQKHLKPEEKK